MTLEDTKVPVKIKFSALWAAVMFCYLYGDYFGLYKPGTLQSMLAGQMGPLGTTTQAILLGVAVMMAIPSVMVSLSLVLPPTANRWTNIALGTEAELARLFRFCSEVSVVFNNYRNYAQPISGSTDDLTELAVGGA